MKLHYHPISTTCRTIMLFAAENAIPLEMKLVDLFTGEHMQPAYAGLNPNRLIPTLEDGDFVLTESAAICLYLAEKFPDARLAPRAATRERAELYRWLLWLSNTVQTTQMRHFYPERYGTEGVEEAANAELADHYDLLDAHLADRHWLVGEERTVADFFLFMLTRWGRFLEPAAWDRPGLRAHWLRTLELRGPRTVIEEQELPLPEFAVA